MKSYILIASLALSGCATTNAWEIVDKKIGSGQGRFEVVETILYLEKQGYTDILLTGDRSEACQDDHAVSGQGVILKVFTQSGAPAVMSAVVCVDWDGNRSLIFDQKQ